TVVEHRAGFRFRGHAHFHCVTLEQACEVKSALGEHVPLAHVRGDDPHVADRFRQFRRAAGAEAAADHPHFRRTGVVRAVDAGEIARISPARLAFGDVTHASNPWFTPYGPS